MRLNNTFHPFASLMFSGLLLIPETGYACNCDLPRPGQKEPDEILSPGRMGDK